MMETREPLRAIPVNPAPNGEGAPGDRTRRLLEAPVLRTLLSLAASPPLIFGIASWTGLGLRPPAERLAGSATLGRPLRYL